MKSERTRIANPIYDGAFKYLLDDNRVARFFLSVLMDEEVVDLELRPTEHNTDIERKSLTVFRIDFAARIRSKDGTEKLVIIEIQKAKYATDIMRFRKYLGQQYASENNVCEDPLKAPCALPIFSIYLLGHKLDYIREPVIRVTREYRDMAGKVITGPREEFIESLTHDSIVVQIPLLKPSRQTDLERLLGLFDQTQAEPPSLQVLSICDDDYPERFQPVIRRLMKAVSEPAIRDKMQVEEDYLNELERLERTIAYREDLIARKEDIIAEKEDIIAEKEDIIAEKEDIIAEKEGIIAQKEDKIVEQNAKLDRAIAVLVSKGIQIEEAKRLLQDS
ncbi:MAG: hypothetical protein LR015_08150 [Verrucomicrobia bacterium]|nr:hypothetical protein [Verrucomicrobiota bacterium]